MEDRGGSEKTKTEKGGQGGGKEWRKEMEVRGKERCQKEGVNE